MRSASLSFPSFPALATTFLVVGLLSGCTEDPATPTAPPVAVSDIMVLDLPSTDPDPRSVATCQTGALVLLEAHGSHDPAGQPLGFEWRDEVDYEDGTGRHASADWEPNVLRTSEYELPVQLYTIAVHYVTLTVRTRDGRSASKTLRVTVTSCERCGP